MLIHLLPVVAFAAIGVLVYSLGRMLLGGKRTEPDEEVGAPRPLAFGPLTHALAAVLPISGSKRESIARELKHAGYYHPFALEEFLSIRNALVIGWVLLTATGLVAIDSADGKLALPILAVGVVGLIFLYGVPRLWLQSVASKRVMRLQLGLPDALDMLTMCLSGGLPLQPSLERVSGELRETHPDFSQELDIIRRHADAHTLEYALTRFSDRIDLPETKSLAALITHTERLGTNVAGALRDYADGIRRNHRQRAEERGNRTSVKLLLPVVLCLAPPIYILLLAPALLELRGFMIRENQDGGILSTADMDPSVSFEELRELRSR